MVWLGQLGLGFVWGWYLGLLSGDEGKRPFKNTATLLLLTTIFTLFLYWQNTPQLPIPFLLTTIFSFIIHKAWINKIKNNQPETISQT